MKVKGGGLNTLALALALAIIFAPRAVRAQPSAPEVKWEVGSGGPVEGPLQVTLGALSQITAADVTQPIVVNPFMHGVPEADYQSLKNAAAYGGSLENPGAAGPSIATNSPSVLTPVTSRTFAGAPEGCGAGGHFIPSDMGLAVGKQFVLQAVNSCVAVFDKTGAVQSGFPKNMNAFFGVAPSAEVEIFDPRAIYDWVNNRYIVTAIQCKNCFTGSNLSWINIAVSQTSDPRGAWNVYHLKLQNAPLSLPVGAAADFDTLGQDRKAIYVGFSVFNPGFVAPRLLFLPKGAMYAGAPVSSFFFLNSLTLGGLQMDTIQPANVMNIGDNPRAEFLVVSENINFGGGQCTTGCGTLVVVSVANPLVAPVFSAVTVASTFTYFLPPSAQQPGCSSVSSCALDTGDTRISGGVTYAAGSLFGSLNTNGFSSGAGSSHVLWFQLRPYLNDSQQVVGVDILNEDCFICGGQGSGNTGSSYYAALQPDPEGNVVMVYSYSDNATPVESLYTSRRVTLTKNLMHDPGNLLQAGLAVAANTSSNRWGDYNATAPDLTSATAPSMWIAADSTKTAQLWRSAIANVRFKATDP